MYTRALALATLCLAGTGARATDFGPLMDVARETWPTKTRIAVVGNYAYSQPEIQALAAATGAECTIVVVDVRAEATGVPRLVAKYVKPDFVVLLRDGPIYREGSVAATWMVRQLAQAGLPSIGTTPRALEQGAVFAVGEATGNQILVNDEVKGTIHVVLPQREGMNASRPDRGRAEIQLARLGKP